MTENQIREASILVVDDQEDGVELLRRLLQKAGYTRIHATTDSRKVMAMYEEVAPDLMILDLHMPAPSGWDILNQLAFRPQEEVYLPILVLTADATPITRVKALSMGAKDFLTKPVDHVDLLLCTRNLIETRLVYRALDRAVRTRKSASDHPSPSDAGAEVLDVLSRVIEHCDPDLGERAKRVSRVAGWIAEAIELPRESAEQIRRACRVFDLGMVGVPGSIRNKSGLLTRSEQELWRRHTTLPEQILGERQGILEIAKQIACGHHERWDGEGYPSRLKGEAIPLPARVVAVAEGYDSLTQAGSSRELATEEVARQAGFAFDPAVAAALASAVSREGAGK